MFGSWFSTTKKLSQHEILLKIRGMHTLQQAKRVALLDAFEKLQSGGGVSFQEAKQLLKDMRYQHDINEHDRQFILNELFR